MKLQKIGMRREKKGKGRKGEWGRDLNRGGGENRGRRKEKQRDGKTKDSVRS